MRQYGTVKLAGDVAPPARSFRLPRIRIGLRCTVALAVMAHAVTLVIAFVWLK